MRKPQQDQILNSLNIIGEANEEIKALFAAEKTEDALRLMIDISELLDKIEDFIAGVGAEGPQTTQLIEEFQALLYQIYQDVNESGKGDNAIVKRIGKSLLQIQNSVSFELKPDRIEAVFIGSRPSSFDSLETVYKAAMADPFCEAYFIPVEFIGMPLTKEHMDFYNSKNVQPVLFKDYDIEARRPDIVFIDYPYDEFGEHYAKEKGFNSFSEYLRKHCRLLVHIPYFIAVYGHILTFGMTYTLASGVRYSDYVFFQSDEIRQTAIKEYTELIKQYGPSGFMGKAKDKFVALGLPKFDGLVNAKEEDFCIPEKWRRIIYRPDGTKKKVILYNTHFKYFEIHGMDYINKCLSVMDTLKNQDDAVILWRPHPNTYLTVQYKGQDVLDAYTKMVSDCKSEGFVIYDDTPDLHRAVVISDALFGCFSSVEALFLAAGKPVMRENMSCFLEGTMKKRGNTAEYADDYKNNPFYSSKSDITDIIDMIYYESPDADILDMVDYLINGDHNNESLEKQNELIQKRFGYIDGKVGNRIYTFCKDKLL